MSTSIISLDSGLRKRQKNVAGISTVLPHVKNVIELYDSCSDNTDTTCGLFERGKKIQL